MTVGRRIVWSVTLPRHAHAHGTVAGMFAADAGLGEVTWENRHPAGPCQFHVAGSRATYEVERSEEPDGRHRFVVMALQLGV